MSTLPYQMKGFSIDRLEKDGAKITKAHLMYRLRRVLTYREDAKGVRISMAKGYDRTKTEAEISKFASFFIPRMKKTDPSYDGTFGIREFLYNLSLFSEISDRCGEYSRAASSGQNAYRRSSMNIRMAVLWTHEGYSISWFSYLGPCNDYVKAKAQTMVAELLQEHRDYLAVNGIEDKGDYFAELWQGCPDEVMRLDISGINMEKTA